MVYTYYRFLDKFHVEPSTFVDLFEFLEYTATETKIQKKINIFLEGNKK